MPQPEQNEAPESVAVGDGLAHKSGDALEVFKRGEWVPCIILKVASYVGRSGPGYYAAYDPPSRTCSEFWTCDRYLRERAKVSK